MPRLRFAMVCAANVNRSMAAHDILSRHKFEVCSYGVAQHVKLPGERQDKPNKYEFGTHYEYIYNDLQNKDKKLYTKNGLLKMLERNKAIKTAPERWHVNSKEFDVIVCFEEKVWEMLLDDLDSRQPHSYKAVLVINIEVQDSHNEAALAAEHTFLLCQMLEEVDSWEDSVDCVLERFQACTQRRPFYTVSWY